MPSNKGIFCCILDTIIDTYFVKARLININSIWLAPFAGAYKGTKCVLRRLVAVFWFHNITIPKMIFDDLYSLRMSE